MYGLRGLGDTPASCAPVVATDPSGNPFVTYPAGCTQTSITVTPSGTACDPATNPLGCGVSVPSWVPGGANENLVYIALGAIGFVLLLSILRR